MKKNVLSLARFATQLAQLLPSLSRSMCQYDLNLFTQGDISLPQVWMLEDLLEYPACTMCALAARVQLQSSTATGLVDRLARHGLVLRRRSRTDRRVVHVALTAKGRRCMEQIRSRKRATLVRGFSRHTPAERMRFLDAVEKLERRLSERTGRLGHTKGKNTP